MRENKSSWPSHWWKTWFCYRVAETNKLELLTWAREEKKCEWDVRTINMAAHQGNLEMVKYCVANKCPMYEFACARAAENGHLECLKHLREEGKVPWNSWTATRAAENGHLHILEYLVERKYDEYAEFSCSNAAENGHLDCLKYLRENRQSALGLSRRVPRARTTTTPSVYNTSSTTTALYHKVGDTNMESCTHRNNHHLHHIKHTYILHLITTLFEDIFLSRDVKKCEKTS